MPVIERMASSVSASHSATHADTLSRAALARALTRRKDGSGSDTEMRTVFVMPHDAAHCGNAQSISQLPPGRVRGQQTQSKETQLSNVELCRHLRR
jgi:hypothetical protein